MVLVSLSHEAAFWSVLPDFGGQLIPLNEPHGNDDPGRLHIPTRELRNHLVHGSARILFHSGANEARKVSAVAPNEPRRRGGLLFEPGHHDVHVTCTPSSKLR
jgi:hypothetical protein